MTGAVDISPYAEHRLTPDQREELWSRATKAGVLITITNRGLTYAAKVAGHGFGLDYTGDSPYEAADEALRSIGA